MVLVDKKSIHQYAYIGRNWLETDGFLCEKRRHNSVSEILLGSLS